MLEFSLQLRYKSHLTILILYKFYSLLSATSKLNYLICVILILMRTSDDHSTEPELNHNVETIVLDS